MGTSAAANFASSMVGIKGATVAVSSEQPENKTLANPSMKSVRLVICQRLVIGFSLLNLAASSKACGPSFESAGLY
jgi:hypothetical protein